MSLFSEERPDILELEAINPFMPLAARMRPRKLDDVIGQEHLTGEGKFLRRLLALKSATSLILYGPPGTGKTTLAQIVAKSVGAKFVQLNATSSGVTDMRKVIESAKEEARKNSKRTLLFIDEIHRLNKGQQDVLLPPVENGVLQLIGATTENPYFEVNGALLSRMKILRLEPLNPDAILKVLQKTIADAEYGLGESQITLNLEVLEEISYLAGGDARTGLNLLEQAIEWSEATGKEITLQSLSEAIERQLPRYDKSGDQHYDVVSAFIKSMRGSDPDATLHYLARMIAAGEDPMFIARRIVICASEDVGLADPAAILVATAAQQAVALIGMPEGRISLAHAALHVAKAPKSNSAIVGIDKALGGLNSTAEISVPLHLRDAHYAGAKSLNHGLEYKYPHNFPNGWVEQEYLPLGLKGAKYYKPTGHGRDK
jgi:ATPase related to the helicase subunit of the Holliday junction resolvase